VCSSCGVLWVRGTLCPWGKTRGGGPGGGFSIPPWFVGEGFFMGLGVFFRVIMKKGRGFLSGVFPG